MSAKKICTECGSEKVILIEQKGTAFPWKDYPGVVLKQSLKLRQCADCGDIITNLEESEQLEDYLIESINKQVALFIDAIIKREQVSQVELAQKMGVSPEYLTEVKKGRKQPSYQIFNLLKILAHNAKAYELSSKEYDFTAIKIA